MKKNNTKTDENEFTFEEIELGFDALSLEEKARVVVYLDAIHLWKRRLKDLIRKSGQNEKFRRMEAIEAAARLVIDEKLTPENALLVVRERGYEVIDLPLFIRFLNELGVKKKTRKSNKREVKRDVKS